MKWIAFLAFLVAALMPFGDDADAAAPRLINYQGILTDEAGTALSGTYHLTFSLYADSSQGATALWSEEHLDVVVESGIFNVVLGSVSTMPGDLFDGGECWLGIAVESNPELHPRQRLVSVPWALRASVADSAATVGSAVSGAWVVSGDDIHSAVVGNAGIGQAAPIAKLHVTGTDQSITVGALEGEDVIIDDSDAVLGLYSSSGGNYGSAINLGEMIGGALNSKWALYRTTGSLPSLRFSCGPGANYASNPIILALRASGNVGIGERSPVRRLVVACDTAAAHIRITTSHSYGSVLELQNSQAGASALGRIEFLNDSGEDDASLVYYADPPLASMDPGLYYYGGGACRLSVSSANGRVGIGTALPQETLDVEGAVQADVIKLTGGADIAEPFDIGESHDVEAGMVVGIDPDRPGTLKVCDRPYDTCVAGITSGAGGLDPGMIMGQEGTIAHGGHPVALTGRVYCRADASNGPIAPGDLLTSSAVPGHAMKVTDHEMARGAVIGKAMTPLESGRGLVLVLVTLQ